MAVFETDGLAMRLDATGRLVSLVDPRTGTDHLDTSQVTYLVSVYSGGQRHLPSAIETERGGLVVHFDGLDAVVRVGVETSPTHLRFKADSVQGNVDILEWGPFYTVITGTIGETVGVVHDGEYAFGIQALNAKTIGGAVEEHNSATGRGTAARATESGSQMQAYTLEREGGVVGSAIGVFGCPASQALETIGEIEVAEGLPHPLWEGEWLKTSRRATESYLISPFGVGNIEQVVDMAARAGLSVVYHPGPFRTWGHFELDPGQFPEGDQSLRQCCETAAQRGVGVGVHTLTAFITTNDPYVTPVPDPRLGRWGQSVLTESVPADATEIPVASPEPFRNRGTLGAVLIGTEILQYGAVSEDEPWRLLDCQRGAFGTAAAAHPAGAEAAHLADHAYRTLFPGIENGMANEMVQRLVELFNRTGLVQISFDGLEGLSQYGYGEWPRNLFVEGFYRGVDHEVISDASNLLHYLWHIHTRMNWGEPWGHATREGMAEYRFQNQEYFRRNLFPPMLGWFQLRLAGGGVPATSVSDVEWVLSKCAGYDAGFALSTSLGETEGNGEGLAILDAVREWESARHAGAFTDEQRERLREPSSEWHLEATGGGWQLQPVASGRFDYPDAALQPGQPVVSAWHVENPFEGQIPRIRVHVKPTSSVSLSEPMLTLRGVSLHVPVEVPAGYYLAIGAERTATLLDANWNSVRTVDLTTEPPLWPSGASQVEFTSLATGATAAECEVSFEFRGPAESLVARER